MDDEYHGPWNGLVENLETVLGRGESGRTSKNHHGCSSLERSNDKESSGEEQNQPRDEEPSGPEQKERTSGSSCR